jgi:hypothetical protein
MNKSSLCILPAILFLLQCTTQHQRNLPAVADAMDNIVSRLYQTLTPEQLDTIGHAYILQFITEEEKAALSDRYWQFNVNVPVRVSVMRDIGQAVVPFWINRKGFKKTSLIVKNEHYTYEVWQKDFPPGDIGLGINGFGKHRPVYFIALQNLSDRDSMLISNVYPENQHFERMEPGAFTYHDWDELVLTTVPEELVGQVLFTTIRGRAREAHVVQGFRKTPFPSSPVPDQVALTWSSDPHNSVDIQWRTSLDVQEGFAEFWRTADVSDTTQLQATATLIENRLLRNDPKVYRHTARLHNLNAGERYSYRVGKPGIWSETFTFDVPAQDDRFSFIWFGDTHRSEQWGDLLKKADTTHPGAAFYSIAGDLVSTGLYRDDWDRFFDYSGSVFARKPLMPVPGNHDNQDGLGAWMYQEMFSLPANGPKQVGPELSYAFEYKNALFIMIDCTSPVAVQSSWIENQLRNTDALWKFAFFHFPPYSWEEDYPEIREEWCSLFDQYHVDMVMSGHVHYYMRSLPVRNGEIVQSPDEGTIYTISVGIPSRGGDMPPEKYAAVRNTRGWLYQHMEIDEGRLVYQSVNHAGEIIDEFSIQKPQQR